MLQVKLKDKGEIVYEEIDNPKPKKDEAVIKVVAVGICGSDMHAYEGVAPTGIVSYVPGHEFGGIIKALGSKNTKLKVGMKVVINFLVNCGSCYYCRNSMEYLCEKQLCIGGEIEGGMKEEILVPFKNIFKLDDSFDLTYSPLIEPTAEAIHRADKIRNSNVLIIGVGTMGLLVQQICKINNNKVVTLDIKNYPLEISKKLMSDFSINYKDVNVINKINKFLGKEKIDVVFDIVCIRESLNFATNIVRKGGEIILVGIPVKKNFELDVLNIIMKEINLISSYHYTDLEFKKAIDYVLSNKIDVKSLVTKIFPLSHAKEAFEYKLNKPSIKIILKNDNK